MTDLKVIKLTDDWQDIPDDAVVEPGGEYRLELGGRRQARRMQPRPAPAAGPVDPAPPVGELNPAQADDFDRLVFEAQEPDRPDTRTIEETLLVALFTTPDARAAILADTRPGDFYFDRHRRLAEAVYPDLAQGAHVDAVTIGAKLPDGDPAKAKERDELLTLAGEVIGRATAAPPAQGVVDAYLTIFVDTARRRLAKSLVAKTDKALDAGELTPVGAAAKVFDLVADLEASRRLVGAFKSEGEDWSTYFAALEASQAPGRDFLGLNTGFDHLNRVANGLTEGLFVLGAAPSTGKTTFVKQLADQVAELNADAVCLFVSYEQSREELRVKTLSRLSGVENRDILRGRLDVTTTGWQRVRQAAAAYRAVAGRVYILEADKTTTVDRVRLAALQVKRATGAGRLAVFVDYLQIVPTEEEYRETRTRVDAVVSDLRRLARDQKAAVVVVSSVGRTSYDAPTLAAYKESGGIEYGADLGAVMTVDRKTKGTNALDGATRDWVRVNLDLVKNRNGERSRITFDFYPEVSRFCEVGQGALPEDFEKGE